MHIIPYSWNLNYFSGKHFPTSSWNTTLLLYYFRGCCSKIPHLAGLNNRHLFSHRCVGWRSRIKVLAGPCAHHVRVLPFTTEPVSFRFKYSLLLIKLSPSTTPLKYPALVLRGSWLRCIIPMSLPLVLLHVKVDMSHSQLPVRILDFHKKLLILLSIPCITKIYTFAIS